MPFILLAATYICPRYYLLLLYEISFEISLYFPLKYHRNCTEIYSCEDSLFNIELEK